MALFVFFALAAASPEGVARAIFCIASREEIVILMTVIKKSSQISKRQFDAAQRRMKEVRTDE